MAVIVDELLCYIANKINVFATDYLEKLCLNAFSAEKIEASKLTLFNACNRGPDDEVIPEVLWYKIR